MTEVNQWTVFVLSGMALFGLALLRIYLESPSLPEFESSEEALRRLRGLGEVELALLTRMKSADPQLRQAYEDMVRRLHEIEIEEALARHTPSGTR